MQEEIFIGVDVAKDEVVYAIDGQSQVGCVANDASSLTAWLGQFALGTRIAMESTGRYHLLLANLAHQAGLRVYVLNPVDVKHFRQSNGIRAKTDRVDAQVIAQMLAERHARAGWRPWCSGTEAQQEIDALLRRRATLAVHRSAIEQAMKDMPAVAPQLQQALTALSELAKAVDRQVQQRVQADERMAECYQRLREIDGVGKQTAAALVNLFTRVPFGNADALVAYVGFDPRPNDSGTRTGRRRITKRGPSELRRLLFLVAQAAGRSRALKPVYQTIRAKGFSTTQALVILARKLLRIAFSIWKTGQSYDARRLLPSTQNA